MLQMQNDMICQFSCLFQAQAKEHSEVVKGLQKLVQFQKESIDSQSEKLTELEKIVRCLKHPIFISYSLMLTFAFSISKSEATARAI